LDLVNGSFALDARLRELSLILDQIFLLEDEDMMEGKEHADLGRFSRRGLARMDVICGGHI